MKQYHVCHGLSKQAESKLKRTEELKMKVEQQAHKASKKLKTLEKQREKVTIRFTYKLVNWMTEDFLCHY